MHELKRVKAAELFPVIEDIIKHENFVWITITGMSMYPFLRDGIDSVELSAASFDKMKKYDIILIKRDDGTYVLHRVLKKEKDCFYMIGDAQQWIEGPLRPDQIVAGVTAIKRKQKVISCENKLYKIAVSLWMLLIPIRHIVFRLYGKFRSLTKHILKEG